MELIINGNTISAPYTVYTDNGLPIPAAKNIVGWTIVDGETILETVGLRNGLRELLPEKYVFTDKVETQKVIFKRLLQEKMQSFHMSYMFGCDEHGNPTVGLRSVENIQTGSLVSWLVFGDAYNRKTGEKMNSMKEIDANGHDLFVRVFAQTIWEGKIMRLCVGEYSVTHNEWNGSHENAGILTLKA